MKKYDYDLFTIGGGSGGVRASRFAFQYGAKVGLAEKSALGGTCVNLGCVPKKLMSYAAHYHSDFKDAAGFGWRLGESTFTWADLIASKDREIARLNEIYRETLTKANVDVIEGHAVLQDAHTVRIDGEGFSKTITAKNILLATGGQPVRPELPGSEFGLVSDDFFHLTTLPRHAIIAGAGYIAVEFASILNGLGCQVTLVHRGAQVLRGMDQDLGPFLTREMEKKGVTFIANTQISNIRVEGFGQEVMRHVQLNNGATLTADCVIFATGRSANTAQLGLSAAGVITRENGSIVVDEHFKTNVDSIYAIGDVIERVALTPVALAEGMVVASQLFHDGKRKLSYENIPTAVFSHPNVATVGLSEANARLRYPNITIFKSEFKALKHTMSHSTERTLMKLVVDTSSDKVLGVHMVGADAGEVMQGMAIALQCGATKAQFDATLGIHPTVAEEFVTMRTPFSF